MIISLGIPWFDLVANLEKIVLGLKTKCSHFLLKKKKQILKRYVIKLEKFKKILSNWRGIMVTHVS